jgi:hypothetical protein
VQALSRPPAQVQVQAQARQPVLYRLQVVVRLVEQVQ